MADLKNEKIRADEHQAGRAETKDRRVNQPPLIQPVPTAPLSRSVVGIALKTEKPISQTTYVPVGFLTPAQQADLDNDERALKTVEDAEDSLLGNPFNRDAANDLPPGTRLPDEDEVRRLYGLNPNSEALGITIRNIEEKEQLVLAREAQAARKRDGHIKVVIPIVAGTNGSGTYSHPPKPTAALTNEEHRAAHAETDRHPSYVRTKEEKRKEQAVNEDKTDQPSEPSPHHHILAEALLVA